MALEQFFNHYPAGEELHKIVTVEQLTTADTQPPAVFLTKCLIQNAAAALRKKNEQIVIERNLPPTPHSGHIVFREALEEVAAIRYGCLVLGLSEAADEGFFDHQRFANRSTLAKSGTLLPNFYVPPFVNRPQEYLYLDGTQKLRAIKESDPSFFSLLLNPGELPKDLRTTLEGEGFLNFKFVQKLAGEMKLRMESFIPHPPRTKKPEPQSVALYTPQEQPAGLLNVLATWEINTLLEELEF